MLIVHSASPFTETISAVQMQGNIPALIIHTSIIRDSAEKNSTCGSAFSIHNSALSIKGCRRLKWA
jgi:hypothetical protein